MLTNGSSTPRPADAAIGAAAGWEIPHEPAGIRTGPGRAAEDIARRADLLDRVASAAIAHGWSKAEVARRSGMAEGTFSQWWSGKYQGRLDTTNATIETWLNSIAEAAALDLNIPESPGWIGTEVALEMHDTMVMTQMMGTFAMVHAEAGIGKTTAAERFVSTRPNCWLATMDPSTRSRHGMLYAVAEAIGVSSAHQSGLVRAIGKKIARRGHGTLLIIDEAQNLIDEAIDQARHFVDRYKCGVVLLGNSESYSRFDGWSEKKTFAQLKRRVFKRMHKLQASRNDIHAFIRAWGITDPAQTEFLTAVGLKPGALGQIDMTCKLAKILAGGAGRELTLEDLRAAWANRGVGSEGAR